MMELKNHTAEFRVICAHSGFIFHRNAIQVSLTLLLSDFF